MRGCAGPRGYQESTLVALDAALQRAQLADGSLGSGTVLLGPWWEGPFVPRQRKNSRLVNYFQWLSATAQLRPTPSGRLGAPRATLGCPGTGAGAAVIAQRPPRPVPCAWQGMPQRVLAPQGQSFLRGRHSSRHSAAAFRICYPMTRTRALARFGVEIVQSSSDVNVYSRRPRWTTSISNRPLKPPIFYTHSPIPKDKSCRHSAYRRSLSFVPRCEGSGCAPPPEAAWVWFAWSLGYSFRRLGRSSAGAGGCAPTALADTGAGPCFGQYLVAPQRSPLA